MNHHLLSIMIFLPLIGVLAQALSLNRSSGKVRDTLGSQWLALIPSIASGILGVAIVASMKPLAGELQWPETLSWVGSYAISYELGMDGLNALPVLLVSVLFPVLITAEWNQQRGARGMYSLFLILQTAFLGAVCSQDLFLQFFFWALSALPFYFLIGIWGGPAREMASLRLLVSSAIGNAMVFSALILVYYAVDPHTFLIRDLAGGRLAGKQFEIAGLDFSVSTAAFALISFGLALRAAVWPLHGWFSHAAEEAPSSVFTGLAAANVPVACFLFIKYSYSLFPETMVSAAPWIVGVGAVSFIVGGVCAFSQRDLRSLMAFFCMSEVGLILIGVGSLNPAGVVGAIYQQLILGLGLAGFGLLTGVVLGRAGRTDFVGPDGQPTLGGAALKTPIIAVVCGLTLFSLLGFPGLGGFVGHALLVIGSFIAHPMTLLLAGGALLLAIYYFFSMYRLVFLGAVGSGTEGWADLSLRERAYFFPLVGALLFFGLYPKPLLELIRPTVLGLISALSGLGKVP